MSTDLGPQKLSTLKKQTLQIERMANSVGLQQSSISNSQTTMMVPMVSSNAGLQNLSAPKKRPSHVISMPNGQGSQQNKRSSQMELPSKSQSESFESVRGKLRESLAASLALVNKQQSKDVRNNSQNETATALRPDNEDSPLAKSLTASVDVSSYHITQKPVEVSSSSNECAPKVSNWQSSSKQISCNENAEGAIQTMEPDGQEFQLKYVYLDEDVSLKDNFLVNDELLQGNGLCWASDLHIDVPEEEENCAKRPKIVPEEAGKDGDGQPLQSPQALATVIEAELFKLFGGVNKKYKEKGRSLLFNLKDPNNPELRERVLSGEIPPHRLCSMTAEELASKELSSWRIAKAEELAQMVVLQDSNVDVRRLVKKTHKGEFEVEFEQDDGASVEVAIGASSLYQFQPKTIEKDAQGSTKPNDSVISEANVSSKDQNLQSDLITLPNDGTDLMQGLVVDELKDAEFLPPIVSLDEFMESLDSEPPFQNLPIDAQNATLDEKHSTSVEDVPKLVSSDLCSTDLDDNVPSKPDTTSTEGLKSNDIEKELETSSPGSSLNPKQDYVWEGLLQLNVSAMVTVCGFFKSGEKASVKEWPNFLDVKGRVRLDAFEKFLQELPMSRSRAIMIVQFIWKDGSSESGRANLCEVVHSYIVDERVGFAEPVAGVELYLCPPHAGTLEMLGKILPKDYTETLNAVTDGLIGIVVWRRPHLNSTISPNSSSHNKHNSKKQHSHLRRQQEKNANISDHPVPPCRIDHHPTLVEPSLDNEAIDDVPPGFGPSAAMDEDDLPEFDFLGGSNVQSSASKFTHSQEVAPAQPHVPTPARPVDQMRELIHKYGQSEMSSNQGNRQSRGVGVEVRSWNDDDDIPEWKPQLRAIPQPPNLQQPLPPPPSHKPLAPQLMQNHLQKLNLPQHMVNQQQFMSVPLSSQQQLQLQYPPQQLVQSRSRGPMSVQSPIQPTTNMMMQQGQQNISSQWQQGTSWTLQPGLHVQGSGLIQSCNFGGQPVQVHVNGTPPNGFGASPNGTEWRPDPSWTRKL